MPNALRIVDIRLVNPHVGDEDIESGAREALIDVVVTVENRSSRTYFVVASLRRIQYDPATRILRIGLHEPAPTPGMRFSQLMLPELVPVLPGETRELRVTIPIQIKQLTFSETSLGLRTEIFDISDVQQVEVVVAYADTPFRPTAGDSAPDVQRKLHAWGHTTQRRLRRRLPTRDTKGSAGDAGHADPRTPPATER